MTQMQPTTTIGRLARGGAWRLGALAALVITTCTGCPVVSNLPAPGRVLQQSEPATENPYYLYVPTTYTDDRSWPLLIACHGTPPWDSAAAQINLWKGWGEQKGFIVAAPELTGTSADFGGDAEAQIDRQRADERAILGIVRSVRASRNINEMRVFMTGWSAGCYAVLFTGLRNPDTFRALSLSQGNFNAAFVQPCVPFLDRHQPIQVIYGESDALKPDSLKCLEWLRSHDMHPVVLERGGFHRRDPDPVFAFFMDVLQYKPCVRVSAEYDPDNPMQVHFRVRTSFEPIGFRWDFGDHEESTQHAPCHVYGEPGLYVCRVAVWSRRDRAHVRHIEVRVPQIRLGEPSAPPAAPSDRSNETLGFP